MNTFTCDNIKDLPFVSEQYRICLSNGNGDVGHLHFEYVKGVPHAKLKLETPGKHAATWFAFERVQSLNTFCFSKELQFDHYKVYNSTLLINNKH